MNYPKPHTVEQVDDYFGVKVADPYRWMEELDAPDTQAWIAEENALTASYFAPLGLRGGLLERMEALTNFERYSAPSRYGTRYFYAHNSGLQNQAVVYWTEGLGGEPQVLIDPNTLAADGTVALAGMSLTEDGRLAALALSDAGSDWTRVFVRDVATGEDLPDEIQWTKFGAPSWLLDGSGFYYAGYGAPPEGDALKAVNHSPKIYFHTLGTAQSDDAVVFERTDDPEIFLHAGVTDDGRYLVVSQHKGTSPNNSVAVLDLSKPDAEIQRVIDTPDAAYSVVGNDGSMFWVYTTLDAPNGKVIRFDVDGPARKHWVTVIPEAASTLESVSLVHRMLVASYLKDARSQVELYREDGTHVETLALPGIGSAGGFGGRREDAETFYTFTNFTTPGTIYRLDLETLASTPYRQPKLLFNPQDYVTEQVFVASKDGTQVPLFLTYKRGLVRDGRNPTLLYAYGGFNVSLTPVFSAVNLTWLERGGIYAQACLRGGGEYGEAWHEAGTRVKKQNVFDDFIACMEWLVAEKYTSAAKLAIQGGSNGGLLVGAMLTQRPELFAAANAAVGVMDMLRFDKFTVGWGWKQDYGSPSENEAEFKAIYAYSPLHTLRVGTKYPATLITTADHDDRVFPAHSFKFAAAMQAAQGGDAPVLIRVETRAGHGGGMPIRKRLELAADVFAFFLQELGEPR
jgi:prolyl oligopeptidase